MATLIRVAAGFGLGVVAGTVLGAISGYWDLARRLLDPTVQALRAIPSLAWVPLFILWLGIFETSKIALIAVGVFFPVYLGVMGAILSVDRKIVEVGRTFRLSGPAMIRRILLPAVLPAYVVALRVGLGLAGCSWSPPNSWARPKGLGYLLIDGQQLGKPAQILAAIVIFAILGKTTDWLIEIATAPLLRWQDAFGRQGGARLMLALDRVGKTYPNGVHALERFSAEIRLGEIVAIIGGSGCGKSTLLRAIAGLDRASAGTVTLDDDRDHGAACRKSASSSRSRGCCPGSASPTISAFGLSDLPADVQAREGGARARAGRPRRQGRCLAARTLRRAGAAGGDRARAGAAAGSAAAGRAVLRARRLHPARPAGSSARPLGRHAADPGAGDA